MIKRILPASQESGAPNICEKGGAGVVIGWTRSSRLATSLSLAHTQRKTSAARRRDLAKGADENPFLIT